MATPAGEGAFVDLDGDHPQPRPGEYLSDAGTHGAESDDADLLELPSHATEP
jgi:hypothetical protein